MADINIYWGSKLHVAEELSEVALFLAVVAVSEAAVERTFSVQKFLDWPKKQSARRTGTVGRGPERFLGRGAREILADWGTSQEREESAATAALRAEVPGLA